MRIWIAAGCVALVAACAQETTTGAPEGQIEHGRYLVTAIGGCNDCHTAHLPSGEPDMAHSLQGAPLPFKLVPELEGHIPWAPTAPQVAGGPAGYTDEQFVHFLHTGERPDHSLATPPMPAFRFNETDAHAVAAYIKTLPRSAP
jgi:cytochrome c553